MLIFLFGEDTFRSRAKLLEILKRYEELKRGKQYVEVVDVLEENAQDVREALAATSLFQEKKLLVFKNVFASERIASTLYTERKKLADSPDTILFFEEGNVPESPLRSFLEKTARTQEFKPLTHARTLVFTREEFKRFGKAIQKDALTLLVQETGSNLWRLSREILTLVSFSGTRNDVTKEDVQLLLHLSLESNVFATVDALSLGERSRALELLALHIKKGESLVVLAASIAGQLRRLLEVHELAGKGLPLLTIQNTLSMKPFLARKLFEISRRFTKEKLWQFFEKALELDRNIKTGRVPAHSALYLFAAQS